MNERSERRPGRSTQEARRPLPIWKALMALVLIGVIVFVAQLCSTAATINVTVNGTQLSLHGAKTMQTAIKESGLPINPGDLISLRGQVLEKHAGHPFHATVNGTETVDPNLKLRNGDDIVLTDGEDIVEDYTSEYEAIPYKAVTGGMGALHRLVAGKEGTYEVRTGSLSGEQVRKLQEEQTDLVRWCYNPDVGDDKVIALTFDNGPSAECTGAILDILEENGVKATFFWVGSNIDTEEDIDLVKRAYEAGHQICTHTYSFGQTASTFDFSSIPAEDQVDEVTRGYQALSDITGAEPSHVIRTPGGMMDDVSVLNLAPYITAEIGWTLDTGDWVLPGASSIYEALTQAQPGDIILCHDASANETTVEALKEAIPYLKDQGFEFITIDEMLAYPEEKTDS